MGNDFIKLQELDAMKQRCFEAEELTKKLANVIVHRRHQNDVDAIRECAVGTLHEAAVIMDRCKTSLLNFLADVQNTEPVERPAPIPGTPCFVLTIQSSFHFAWMCLNGLDYVTFTYSPDEQFAYQIIPANQVAMSLPFIEDDLPPDMFLKMQMNQSPASIDVSIVLSKDGTDDEEIEEAG